MFTIPLLLFIPEIIYPRNLPFYEKSPEYVGNKPNKNPHI